MQGFQNSAMPPFTHSTSTLNSLIGSERRQNPEVDVEHITPDTAVTEMPPLLFALDRQGRVLSLGWPWAERYQLDLTAGLGQPLEQWVTQPCPLPQDLLTDRAFASTAIWHWQFPNCLLKGTVQGSALGHPDADIYWLGSLQVEEVVNTAAQPLQSDDGIQSQLSQLVCHIRRTLDLETIWQQVIEGLTDLLPAEWGVFCTYAPHEPTAVVMASTTTTDRQPELDGTLALVDFPGLQAALRSKQPLRLSALDGSVVQADETGEYWVTMTRHQGEPNGLVVLKASTDPAWCSLSGWCFQEALEQMGTAIAHAHLFRDAQGLADELQAANQRLRQKHRELEEARQQAEEASRLKSEFLANTSHELRTPLNGMIGFLRLILDGMADDPEEQEEFLQEAHKSALHLLNLINDVLDIAKIEAGKMQIDMSQIKLRELFADVENFTRPQAEQKGLRFEINLPSTRDEITVNGNYQRLLQVMLNLVGNAIKFTHEGSITIGAEIKSQKVQFQDQEWPGVVKVSVADTGIGVSLEKQNRLFQTFSQVDGERTRQYGGTGLGLAISQRLIEAMGGVVQFISMGEGLGSTVTFTILLYQEPVLIE